MQFLDRQQITDLWTDDFDGLNDGYWITLNSKNRVKNFTDPLVKYKLSNLAVQVGKYVMQLNEYCYRRQYLKRRPGAELRCLVGYEIGDKDDPNRDGQMLHAHIVAAHDGSTNRTVSDVERITRTKWSKFQKFAPDGNFIHVEDLDNVRDRVWYISKQAVAFQRWHGGELNVMLT
ncbi:MAG: hypothetical protein NT123_24180 [Proteobacteria bacterium]|nr:hypothetical protein [Pseudomonadota bacterium]